jgi:hypothetical protein
MYQSTNYWGDPEYKGINTRWITRQGQRFEVQFHTPESFHAKQQVTHESSSGSTATLLTNSSRSATNRPKGSSGTFASAGARTASDHPPDTLLAMPRNTMTRIISVRRARDEVVVIYQG